MKTLLALSIVALAPAGCYQRAATHSPDGLIQTSAPLPEEEPAGSGTIRATTAYAYAPEPKELPPFDARAAREAFGRGSVAACGSPFDGHAKVTFAPDGTVAKVVVDYPFDLPAEVRTCIVTELARIRITAFGGPAVTLGTSWRAR